MWGVRSGLDNEYSTTFQFGRSDASRTFAQLVGLRSWLFTIPVHVCGCAVSCVSLSYFGQHDMQLFVTTATRTVAQKTVLSWSSRKQMDMDQAFNT